MVGVCVCVSSGGEAASDEAAQSATAAGRAGCTRRRYQHRTLRY